MNSIDGGVIWRAGKLYKHFIKSSCVLLVISYFLGGKFAGLFNVV